jgi:hypothetical protein
MSSAGSHHSGPAPEQDAPQNTAPNRGADLALSDNEVDPSDSISQVSSARSTRRRRNRNRNRRNRGPAGVADGLLDPVNEVGGQLSKTAGQTVGQVGNTLGGVTGALGGVTGQGQQANEGGGDKKDTLRLRLDLNLDAELTLKAKVHGDVTLALL